MPAMKKSPTRAPIIDLDGTLYSVPAIRSLINRSDGHEDARRALAACLIDKGGE
jgi:hypothetical protein